MEIKQRNKKYDFAFDVSTIGSYVDEVSDEFINSTVDCTFDQGIKECIELTFDDGNTLVCTTDHLILTQQGWIEAGDLTDEDDIKAKRSQLKIVSSKLVGKRHVRDIEVRHHHNFVANGVVVHNCTSRGAQKFFVKAVPKSIIDIAALSSIYRPGPLAADVDKLWMKHKEEHYDWGNDLINETLKETRGLLVFQESVMALANKVAGFPLEQCDEVRRAIMKRSISGGDAAKQKAQELENDFVSGAMKNGVPEDIAKKAYQTVLWMSGYGFNKSLSILQKINTYLPDGQVIEKQLNEVVPGDKVLTRDEKSGENLLTEVLEVHDHGTLELVEVELKTGEKIKCTMNHKFRTLETGEMLPLWMIMKQGYSIVVKNAEKSL
jgi:DNA polymerase-3 subunit alpha